MSVCILKEAAFLPVVVFLQTPKGMQAFNMHFSTAHKKDVIDELEVRKVGKLPAYTDRHNERRKHVNHSIPDPRG